MDAKVAPYPPENAYPPAPGYAPPQPGFAPAQPGYAPVFVATATPRTSSYPIPAKCPNCHKDVVTSTSTETGLLTWLLCGGSILFGCVLGCCLIPFCVDACKDVKHVCPECKFLIGKYERIR